MYVLCARRCHNMGNIPAPRKKTITRSFPTPSNNSSRKHPHDHIILCRAANLFVKPACAGGSMMTLYFYINDLFRKKKRFCQRRKAAYLPPTILGRKRRLQAKARPKKLGKKAANCDQDRTATSRIDNANRDLRHRLVSTLLS